MCEEPIQNRGNLRVCRPPKNDYSCPDCGCDVDTMSHCPECTMELAMKDKEKSDQE